MEETLSWQKVAITEFNLGVDVKVKLIIKLVKQWSYPEGIDLLHAHHFVM